MVAFIRAYQTEIQPLDGVVKVNPIREKLKWLPPTDEYVKANFDTAYNTHSKKAVAGTVLRDNMGLILGASTYPFRNIDDPTTAEAVACRLSPWFNICW